MNLEEVGSFRRVREYIGHLYIESVSKPDMFIFLVYACKLMGLSSYSPPKMIRHGYNCTSTFTEFIIVTRNCLFITLSCLYQ